MMKFKIYATYKDCLKCLPFAWTQARSHERHWSIVLPMMLCSRLSPHVNQTLLQIVDVSRIRRINVVLHRTL